MRMITVITLLIISLSSAGYGETDFNKLYNLTDKNSLERIIHDTEKSNPLDKDSLKVLGIAYHNLGRLEIKGLPDKAVEYLEKANQLSPADYEALAYLGSAKTMVARDSWNFFTKLSKVNEGINMMDRAVSKSPDNIAIRMVRANNSLKLPGFLNRKGIAMKDFQHLATLIQMSEGVSPDLKAEIFYQLGMLYKSDGNESLAKEYFKKAVNVSPDSKWGIDAKKEL
ncbi:MAG: tetratricopeptide repeat protein [Nitrospinae bacterium]|nr:tetratricopeptide repeat protein [Nitrospinota bacterium]